MTKAYAAQLVVGTGLTTTPYWVMELQGINLILGTIAAIIGILVGGHALFKIIKGKD